MRVARFRRTALHADAWVTRAWLASDSVSGVWVVLSLSRWRLQSKQAPCEPGAREWDSAVMRRCQALFLGGLAPSLGHRAWSSRDCMCP